MLSMTIREVRHAFSDTVSQVGYGNRRIVLRRGARDIAALVPLRDLERLQELDAEQNGDGEAA